jgi:predicted DNA-binding transcriptional regulator AlpA
MSLIDPTPLSSRPGIESSLSSTRGIENSPPSTYGIERLISERELCALLGIGIPTIARWRAAGKGPRFVVLGVRRLAYRPSDVRAWLAECERSSGSCSVHSTGARPGGAAA